MSNGNKIIYALYDDDHDLMEAAKKLVAKGVRVNDVYSPFPIHGLDPVIGIKRTRMAIVAFLFGITGLSLALLGICYFMIGDWPMNIGGKPSFTFIENIPSFIPVTFEFTVFCAAHGMALTYLIRNRTLPGLSARNPDPRTTDDKFLMEILTTQNRRNSAEEIIGMINESAVSELTVKDI
ncbi:MAG: DUF3341 domain-containing protein [Bacteroidetes bacterium]|nr:DUF3341 domain-containing protein [Bacteroidota bacterium]HET6244773.1 DUF3341 domain-containing protein [Bacteroidia bacterium]